MQILFSLSIIWSHVYSRTLQNSSSIRNLANKSQTTISDLVQISPEDFEKPSIQAIEDNINAKYADKVIQKVGLCIGLYDILSSTDGLIGHGTGVVNVNG